MKSGPATLVGNKLTITGGGTVVLAADQPGNGAYAPAPEVTTSFTVNPAAQSITYPAIATKIYGTSFNLRPNASSSLPISYSVLSGPAMAAGNVVTITGVGRVEIAANQTGTSNYSAAKQVTRSFMVIKAAQKIAAFSHIAATTIVAAPFTITLPTSNSGLPVTVRVNSGPATISGNTVTLKGKVGTVILEATCASDANHLAAPEVTTRFVVK